MVEAREAIAKQFTLSHAEVTKDHVFLASGCSDALNMAIAGLVDEGENILLPAPGFSLYRTICARYNIKTKFYSLVAERGWEADLEEMEKQIDHKTKAILVNNP